MVGLPQNISLKHPSSYGRLTLKQILSNKDNITVHGMYNTYVHKIRQHTICNFV